MTSEYQTILFKPAILKTDEYICHISMTKSMGNYYRGTKVYFWFKLTTHCHIT